MNISFNENINTKLYKLKERHITSLFIYIYKCVYYIYTHIYRYVYIYTHAHTQIYMYIYNIYKHRNINK